MRRLALALAALSLLLAGCAGIPGTSAQDAREAQRLLEESQAAQAEVESMTFTMTVGMEGGGQQFRMVGQGALVARGEHAGDMTLTMRLAGGPVASLELVAKDGVAYMRSGGSWIRVPGASAGTLSESQQLDALLSAVRDVKVERHTTFLGEPVAKIVGTVDTQKLLDGLLGQLGGAGLGSLDQVKDALGDVHVALYISEVTHLPTAVHEELAMRFQGQTARLTVDLNVTSVDEPVKIAVPSAALQAA